MIWQFTSQSPLVEGAWAGGILAASVLIAWLITWVLGRVRRRIEERRKATSTPDILRSISKPVFVLVTVQGFLLALRSLSYLEPWYPYITGVAAAVAIVLVTHILAVIIRPWLNWYMCRREVRPGLTQLTNQVTTALIYIIGLLVLLQSFGIAISPILAGLGIGGLAIALALQPTLSNFLAGAQLVFDRTFHIGDYIELDTGERGFVQHVGWRSTRVRSLYNNVMIVPNSRLIATVVTNYHRPDMSVAVLVEAGVSYSSDLAQVERVALAASREVVAELPEAVEAVEPFFAFEEIGEANINFWIWLYAKDRSASFRLKSELIKRLHSHFDREGIVINYPVRLISHGQSGDGGFIPAAGDPGLEGPEETR